MCDLNGFRCAASDLYIPPGTRLFRHYSLAALLMLVACIPNETVVIVVSSTSGLNNGYLPHALDYAALSLAAITLVYFK